MAGCWHRERMCAADTTMCCARRGILVAVACVALLPATVGRAAESIADGYDVAIWTTDDGLPENDVTAVLRVGDGYLLVGTNNHGVVTFNGVSFRPVPLEHGIPPRVHRMLIAAGDTPIISFLGGMIGAYRDGQVAIERRPVEAVERVRWVLDRHLAPPADAAGNGDWFLTRDQSVVCRRTASGKAAWELVSVGGRSKPQPNPDRAAVDDGTHVASGRTGTWQVTDSGLRHEPVNGAPTTLEAGQLGFDTAAVQCLTADDEGNLWLGLRRQGLARIRPTLFRSPRLADGGVLVAGAASLCEDASETVWVTSPGGAVWKATGPGAQSAFIPVVEASRPGTEESVITTAGAGGAWVATQSIGLFRAQDGDLLPVAGAVASGMVTRAMLEIDGTLWRAGREGLVSLDAAGGNARLVPIAEAFGPEPLSIESLAPATDGGLWVGGSWSRLVHRAADGTCTLHKAPWSQPGQRFWALLSDASIPGRETAGGVWVGTLGHGLVWFDPAAGRFHQVTSAHGLPDDTVCQILADSSGSLWLGTYHGVVRVGVADLADVVAGRSKRVSCRRFGRDDGLPATQCSSGRQPACLAARDGSLWFATDAGIAVTDPAAWPPPPPPPPVVIEEVTIAGRDRRLPATSQLALGPHDRRIEFSFAGLWLANPVQIRYRWRIAGIDTDWVDGGSSRRARYDRLPPGRHVFEVSAAHADGPWGDAPARVSFTIPPHVHETAWFRTVAALAALGVAAATGAAMIRWRHRRQQELAERERAVERERARIAQDLHDDLGASLTEIDLLGALAANSGMDGTAAEHIHELRSRAHHTVAALDEIVWAVNPRNDSLGSLKGYIADFVQHFLRATPLQCELDLGDVPDDIPLPASVRHAVFQATKEAVHNVVRHAAATACTVRLRLTTDQLEVEVADDGRGFDRASPGFRPGDGLGNMEMRMVEIGGRCATERLSGGGTRVTLVAPCASAAAQSFPGGER
jgi:signal transduction histidine kinase/ligand-binding sensor domain-containing protein